MAKSKDKEQEVDVNEAIGNLWSEIHDLTHQVATLSAHVDSLSKVVLAKPSAKVKAEKDYAKVYRRIARV